MDPIPPAPSARRTKGFWPGLAAVLAIALALLAHEFVVADARFARNFVRNDGSYNLMNVLVILSPGPDVPLARLVREHPPLDMTTNWCTIYGRLPYLTAWALKGVLPVKPAVGVFLNGVWYLVLAVSAYVFWAGRTGRALDSVALTTVLLSPGFLLDHEVAVDLAALEPNVVAYLLGVATLCWVLMSDGFSRPGASAVAGVVAGLLALGRVFTLALVAAMAAPCVVLAVRRARRGEGRKVALGVALAAVAFSLVGGWHVVAHRAAILAYPTQFGVHSTVGRGLSDAVYSWTRALGEALTVNGPVLLVLVVTLGARVRRESLATVLRELHLGNAWTAASPALVLLAMHAKGGVYLWPAFLAVLLVLVEPFRASGRVTWPEPGRVARGALLVATGLSVAGFVLGTRRINAADTVPLSDGRAVVATIRDHARAHGKTRITVGVLHWATLHDASVACLFVYGAGCRLDSPLSPPVAGDGPLTVSVPLNTPWQWKPHIAGPAKVRTGARYAKLAEESYDYVILPVNRTPMLPEHDRAAELLCRSPRFEVISPPLDIMWDGPVMVLARKEGAH